MARGVEGGDHNCCAILDRRTRKIVVRHHELCDASQFGVSCSMLAVWYGAQIAVEVNDAGATTLGKMYDIVGPDYLWAAHRFTPGAVDDELARDRYGWRTTYANHEWMIQALIDVVRDDLWEDLDEEFWAEAMECVREPSGKAHITGLDRVASACILAMMDRLTPAYYVEPEPSERDSARYDYSNPRIRRERAIRQEPRITADYSGMDWQYAGFPAYTASLDDDDPWDDFPEDNEDE